LIDLSAPESTPNLFNGAIIYNESCEPCHGPVGLGDGSMASNLEVEPPPLADLDTARAARPLDWYTVVTEGRMDRFMPPFRSLSAAQRWDVTAYALSLNYPIETSQLGAELYAEGCATCHGEEGQGADKGPALNDGELFAERSLDMILATIKDGKGDMPGFGDSLPDEAQLVLAAYTQSLGTIVHPGVGTTEDLPSGAEAPDVEVTSAVVRGSVVNGTAGMGLPDSLEVTVIGLDGDFPAIEKAASTDRDGNYSVEGLEIVPGRIYGALVEYQDVIYFSVGGHLLEETPFLELPLVIYETTTDEDLLAIERLHLIFDFSVAGLVEVSELWLLSTDGDHTVVQDGGLNALPIQLPDGFSNLRFGEAIALDQFTLTEQGFVLHEAIRPNQALELIFSFTLPYERSLDFIQPVDFPVQAVVLLTESDAPELQGTGVQDLGERDMGGIILHSYMMEALEPGNDLALRLRGPHPLTSLDSSSNLAIGLGVLGVVLIVLGIGWWGWQRRADHDAGPPEAHGHAMSREQLLREIAELDDDYEAGKIDEPVYEQRRSALKSQLLEQMQDDDD
jgi:mono/diheme cytochrome c family protein